MTLESIIPPPPNVVGEIYKFTIPGNPVAWKRPGINFSKRICYDQQVKEKEIIQQHAPFFPLPLSGPVMMLYYFYLPIRSKCKARDGLYHTTPPDQDNLVKIIKDALNTIAYHDDGQVCYETQIKKYSSNPRTEILIANICD